MGMNHLLTLAISGYRTFVENVELSPPVQHYASSDENSKTTAKVSFHDVTGMQTCSDLSPSLLVYRINCCTEMTFICKENISPLMKCPVFDLFAPLKKVLPMANFVSYAAFRTVDK